MSCYCCQNIFLGPVDVTQIAANFVSNKAEVIIRMRGLPFHTKEGDVVSFSSKKNSIYDYTKTLLTLTRKGNTTLDLFNFNLGNDCSRIQYCPRLLQTIDFCMQS